MEFKRKKNLQFVVMETRQMDNWLQLMTVEGVLVRCPIQQGKQKPNYFSLFR